MEPKDILAISGKPGLYKVLNTTHRAIVVEPLGEEADRRSGFCPRLELRGHQHFYL